jgi:signal transduction histidine kinase
VRAATDAASTGAADRRGFLGAPWYPVLDGVIALLLVMAGWLADAGEFVAGGYPVSWLFVVAYAANLRWTVLAGLLATAVSAVLHLVMEQGITRVVGSVQFVVVAVVAGWAIDHLRRGERLRLLAERALADEQAKTARLEERAALARSLHDSVLQTLKLIGAGADDPSEVRYLARTQERDLQRTINAYRSPHADGLRTRLLDAGAAVEDRFRVRIEHVIRDDAAMDHRLHALVEAAAEAMANAARHSGSDSIDLYAEVGPDAVTVTVRDRGRGFDPDTVASGGIAHSIVGRMAAIGGTATIRSRPGAGTEVLLVLPTEEATR